MHGQYSQDGQGDAARTTEKFSDLLHHIENQYVDSVHSEKLVEEAIKGMLKELDPHSIYISEKQKKDMREPLRGNFEGVGIRFNILHDTIMVVSPIPGGPSEKVGIRSGDKIVEIEGENVAGTGITNNDVMNKLRGKKGSKVNVGIYRSGVDRILDFEITRDKIPLHSVSASYMATPRTGYLKVNRFSGNTMPQFKKGLKELKEQNMENLILDLQGNGGGYLKTAIKMADEFLKKDRLIVYTKGRAYPKSKEYANSDGAYEDGNLIVLIDQSSASASEIVSGAIQDWDRGLVVGRRSFGKGLVQRPIDLPDGSAVRLTISRYYTPSGRCIQKPFGEDRKEYYREKYERLKEGELTNKDSIDLPDSLKYRSRIKDRVVFGGGGIHPDVFVPLDTSRNSEYYSKLQRKGLLNGFALDHVDKRRSDLIDEYPDARTFKEEYQVDEALWNKFKTYAADEGVEFVPDGYEKSQELLHTQIKALMAQNLFDREAFYMVINRINDSYQKSLQILENGAFDDFKLADSEE